MFEQSPKVRRDLPAEYEKIHASYYKANRDGATRATCSAKKLERWMHAKVAADVKTKDASLDTLEIGAGTLTHLAYEPECTLYDIIEPFSSLYAGSRELSRVGNVYKDIKDLPAGRAYSRIISIATLGHICNLPEVVARAALLLSAEGSLRVGIPSEGGFLWRLGRTCTTAMRFRFKYGAVPCL